MGKGGKTTTVQSGPDAASQAYIQQMRQRAQQAAGVAAAGPEGGGSWFTGPLTEADITGAMSPYLSNVVGGVRGEFDHLRGAAMMGADQAATQAGAFGGSRHGIMAGARLGELDRAQTSQIAGLLNSGYADARQFAGQQQQLAQQQRMEPLWRQQQGLNFMNLGMGPVGMSSTTNEKGSANPWGDVLGAGLTAYGIYAGMKGRGPGGYQAMPMPGTPGGPPMPNPTNGQGGLWG